MKKLLLATMIAFSSVIFSQEKINYNKDVYPLIKEGKYSDAYPILELFLKEKPDHINANYWFAKLSESKAKESSDPLLIKLAATHYAFCFNNVSELEMTMATAGRYPDARGIETTERLNNFKIFLKSKYEECGVLEQKFIKENESKKRENELAELSKKKQIEEDAKIKTAELSGVTIDEFITNTELIQIKKILGSYGESISEEGGDWNFKYEYNSIDGKPKLNGKISGDFQGQISHFEGEIHNGDGYIAFYFNNFDIYATQAIKLYYQGGKCVKLRGETLMPSSELFFFETSDLENFDAERFLEITDNPYDVKAAEKISLGNRNWSITKFQGYSDSEEEGADIVMKGFSFLPVFKKYDRYYVNEEPIVILEENVLPQQIITLKNNSLVDKYFELNCEAFQFKSDIFQNQDTVFALVEFKEVQIFLPENYASKYKESITSEELSKLNVLVMKWHESVTNGNYEAYKSLTAKGAQWNLEEFTKFNKEFHSIFGTSNPNSRYTFQKSNNYIVTAGDVVISRESKYTELKNSGSDLKKLIILLGVYRQDSKEDGDLVFVKENGTWKVLGKVESSDVNKFKTYQVLSKENLTVCNCIEKVISGDVYNAEKCAFFFKYKKIDDKELVFEECFKTLNYCDYDKQCKSMELGLGYSNSQKSKECRGQ